MTTTPIKNAFGMARPADLRDLAVLASEIEGKSKLVMVSWSWVRRTIGTSGGLCLTGYGAGADNDRASVDHFLDVELDERVRSGLPARADLPGACRAARAPYRCGHDRDAAGESEPGRPSRAPIS